MTSAGSARTLHLLRHAKSSWDDPALPDHERPLAARGARAATAMRDHAAAAGLRADLVLVSSARRARETWEAVAPGVESATVRIEPAIYEATVAELLELVRGVDREVRSLLLVGHDPGFHQLALALAGGGDDAALTALRQKYPTGALASLTLDGQWRDTVAGAGRLVSFVRPRDLE